MIIKLERIEIQSRQDMEMVDVTDRVASVVQSSGVSSGLVNVMTTHTSSGLLVTEGLPDLERDILAHLERLAPKELPGADAATGYWHNRYLDFDGRLGFNAGDHLKSILGGTSCIFPIENGCIVKGSRQRIYFVEYDGPLARTFVVQVLGD